MYSLQLIAIATGLHVATLLLPGPDFTIVTSTALLESRQKAHKVTFGITLATAFYIVLSIFGLSLVISHNERMFTAFKLAGGIYLILMSYSYFRESMYRQIKEGNIAPLLSEQAVAKGALAELSNPKAILFYITVFTIILRPSTAIWLKSFIGTEIVLLTFAYYWLISSLASKNQVKNYLLRYSHWVERVTAIILFVFGIELVVWGSQFFR